MKHYIFVTYSILGVGGGQCYVASKAQYLESEGWHVVVLSDGYKKTNRRCPINYLNKFRPYMVPELGVPLFKLPKWLIKRTINRLLILVGRVSDYDEIIIESHDDRSALWGELLAKQVNGRHYFYTLNERFRGEDKFYKDKIDFYLFKFHRNEILSSCQIINRLFEGYLNVKESEIERLQIDEEPVQDVESALIENLATYDYNICYFGRAVKPYVPNIIEGVGEFASKNKGKIVQFIIIGDASCQKERLSVIKEKNKNLIVTEFGPLHPIPRKIFSKLDVVIAGSGCARCSVEEGAITIIADPESKQALGLLGYDTNNSVLRDSNSFVSSFYDAINRALIEKIYLKMEYKYPPKLGVSEATKQNFRLMKKGAIKKVYYDENLLIKGKIDYSLLWSLLLQRTLIVNYYE